MNTFKSTLKQNFSNKVRSRDEGLECRENNNNDIQNRCIFMPMEYLRMAEFDGFRSSSNEQVKTIPFPWCNEM